MHKRAVITGIGLLTPLGNTPEAFFDAAVRGKCGIKPVTKFDTSNLPIRIGGQIEFDEQELNLSRRRLAEMPELAKWGVLAARKAVADAGLDLEREDRHSIDVVTGVAAPAFDVFQAQAIKIKEQGAGAAVPETPVLANPAIVAISIGGDLDVHGELINISTSCSSGAHAMGYAARLIQSGESSCILAGGADEGVSPIFLSAFGNGSILSKRNEDPMRASRPFDRQRDGYVLSDAACIFVVEEYERARARHATIYCELSGFGATSDASAPTRVGKSEESSARAVEKAMRHAQKGPDDIDYYCAHGSSSRWTDIRETRMLKRVFRERAPRLQISSVKSMMGHAVGAAGAVQAATCALAIRHGAIPPTINHDDPDPECDLDYVPNQARSVRVRNALIYSLGMGGSNAALVLSAC
jgi:3-oxoacyl-[acyl-carrier-protein] synthase II